MFIEQCQRLLSAIQGVALRTCLYFRIRYIKHTLRTPNAWFFRKLCICYLHTVVTEIFRSKLDLWWHDFCIDIYNERWSNMWIRNIKSKICLFFHRAKCRSWYRTGCAFKCSFILSWIVEYAIVVLKQCISHRDNKVIAHLQFVVCWYLNRAVQPDSSDFVQYPNDVILAHKRIKARCGSKNIAILWNGCVIKFNSNCKLSKTSARVKSRFVLL